MLMKIDIDTTAILTKREKLILKELIGGLQIQEISKKYNVTVKRTELIIHDLCEKLGIDFEEP